MVCAGLQIWTIFRGACNCRTGPQDIWTICVQHRSDWLSQWAWGLRCGRDMHRATVWDVWGTVGAWPGAWWSVRDNITGSNQCCGQGCHLWLGSHCPHHVSVTAENTILKVHAVVKLNFLTCKRMECLWNLLHDYNLTYVTSFSYYLYSTHCAKLYYLVYWYSAVKSTC